MPELSLEQAIAELPDTADGIAEFLIEQECRGNREDGTCCPVARYLQGTGLFPDAFVDFNWIFSDGADYEGEGIEPPPHIAEFVERFDRGEWPELDANAEVPDEVG